MNASYLVQEVAPIWFKIIPIGEKLIIDIPTNVSMANFIEHVKNNFYQIFQINRNQKIEIVEAGQSIPGVNDEDAPAVVRNHDIKFYEKYNGEYSNLAFYIRC
jgi:hypothetical protein